MHVLYWIVTLIVLIVVSAGLWWVFSSLFGRGEELGPAERPDERKDLELGATVGPDELSTMRFSLSFRGYSPREVDMALQRAREHMIELEHDRDRYRRRADDAEEQLKASGAGTAASNDAGDAEGTAKAGSAPVGFQSDGAQSTHGSAEAADHGEVSHSGDTHVDDHHQHSGHQNSAHSNSAKTNRAQGKRKKKRKKSKRR